VLTAPPLPDGSTDVLARQLARAAASRNLPGGLQGQVQPGLVTATVPLHVFTLGLDQLSVRFAPAVDAIPGSWRILLEVQREVVATADVDPTAGGPPEFVCLSAGPLAAGTARAVLLAESQLAQTADYVLAALDVPALGLNLLWLRSPAGPDRDLYLSLLNCPDAVQQDVPYTLAALAALLPPLARAALAQEREHPTNG
jgi:hypothetical protein